MPLFLGALFSFLAGLLGQLAVYFGKVFAERTASVLAVLTLMVAAWTTAYAALKAVWFGMGLVFPRTLVTAFMMVKPTHFDQYLAAYITGRVIISTYRWAKTMSAAAATSSPVFKNLAPINQ